MKKRGIAKWSVSVREPRSYLSVTLTEDAELEDFCVEIASRNHIYGLLPMSRQFVDGKEELLFDVTGMRRLADYLAIPQREETIRTLLSNLVRALRALPEYFLHTTQCILDSECIYADSHFQVGLVLVPMKNDAEDGREQVRDLLLDLLDRCSASGVRDELRRRLEQPSFNLDEVSALLSGPAAPEKAEVREPKPEPAPAAAPAEKPPVPPKKQEAERGFAVPFAEPEKSKKEKAPAGEKKGFSLFGKKKAEAKFNEGAYVISQGAERSAAPAVPVIPERQERWRGTAILNEGADAPDKTTMLGDAQPKRVSAAFRYNGRRVEMTPMPFTVGRTGCSFLMDSQTVSRKHATFFVENGSLYVQDEHSSNHTYVNGVMIEPLTPCRLSDGAEVRLGKEQLIVELEE